MFKQHFYPTPEKEYTCEICSEAVTNPLCPSCLAEELDAWTTLYPHLRTELLPKVKKYLSNLKKHINNSVTCIKCKNARASVCPHCFMDFVEGELKEIDPTDFIINEFTIFFDFDEDVPDPHKAKWADE